MSLSERPEDLTREDLEMKLFIHLAGYDWEDITGTEGADPKATLVLALGLNTPLLPIWLLSRYEEEGGEATFSLVGCKGEAGEWKTVTSEQFKLEWLWEQTNGTA